MANTPTPDQTEARQPPRSDAPADSEAARDEPGAAPAEGANRGSPAASVMKQFAKTETESGGNRK